MPYKGYKKKYKINKARFRELLYFGYQYMSWKEEIAELTIIGSPSSEGGSHGSAIGDPTGNAATRLAETISKVRLVDDTVREACVSEGAPDIAPALLIGVITPGMSPNILRARGKLFYGNDKYYMIRSKFYWLLDKRRP